MPPSPETPQVDVTEVLHGEAIPDPYRWLEDGDAPETRLWTEQQNAVTEAYLAAAPGRDRVGRRRQDLLGTGAVGVPTPRQGRYFYLRRDGRQSQPVLYWREGVG